MKTAPNTNIQKQITWDILQATMLSYEGADPRQYGLNDEISRIGQQLATALFNRTEKLIQHYKSIGLLKGGTYSNLYWAEENK